MTHRQFVWTMILITVVAALIMWTIPMMMEFIADFKAQVDTQTQVR